MKTLKNGTTICHTNVLKYAVSSTDSIGKNVNRFEYEKHYCYIENTRQLKACIRAGRYVFPGGYEIIFYTSDGVALCYNCVKNNLSNIVWSIRNNVNDGWRVIGTNLDYGESEQYCDNCNYVWEIID